MRKNKYYRITKTGCKFIRDKFAANPTESLNIFGLMGKFLGYVINYLIAKPIRLLVFGISGLIYKNDKHPTWFGAVIYTLNFLIIMGSISVLMSKVIEMF